MGCAGNIVRLTGAVVLLTGVIALHFAANKAGFLAECEHGLPSEMQAMDDIDLAERARALVSEGNMEAALSVLRYGIENGIGRPGEATALLANYTAEAEQNDTVWGKIKSGGSGFITGECKGIYSSGGSLLSDLTLYGDVRDLTRESMSDDPDTLTMALAGAGIACTFLPHADAGVAVLKSANKFGLLSRRLAADILEAIKNLRIFEAGRADRAADMVKPFSDLYRAGGDINSVMPLVKASDSLEHVKILSKAGTNSTQVRKLALSYHAVPAAWGDELFAYLKVHGERGADALYNVMRKGQDGVAYLIKRAKPTGIRVYDKLCDLLTVLAKWLPELFGVLIVMAKALLSALGALLIFGRRISRLFRRKNSETATQG